MEKQALQESLQCLVKQKCYCKFFNKRFAFKLAQVFFSLLEFPKKLTSPIFKFEGMEHIPTSI